MKILVAMDGSPCSFGAIDFLSRFPFSEKPETILIYAFLIPDYYYLETGSIPLDVDRAMEMSRQAGQKILEEVVAKCLPWSGSVRTEVISTIALGKAIVDFARKIDAELIVTGARGLGAVSRFLLGSVSEAIAQHPSVP